MELKSGILVTLNISFWQANCRDVKISEQVTADHDVKDKRLGRFWKSLLPKSATVTRVSSLQRAARQFHYENTLTWMHDGPRVLPTANYDAYMARIREFKSEFELAVLELIGEYDALKQEAKVVLGQMYNEADYPIKSSLKQLYRFDMTVTTIPDSAQLRAVGGLSMNDAEALSAKLESDMRETFNRANQRLWEDLYSRLSMLTSRLADSSGTIRDSMVDSVKELAQLLPRLNMTNDENLDAMAKQLQVTLDGVSGEAVRNNPSTRHRVATEASFVFNVMQSYMKSATEDSSSAEILSDNSLLGVQRVA